MNASLKYGVSALLLIGVLVLALWPFLDQPQRRGVLTAGSIALPVQVAAFSVLVRYREGNRFLAAWAGGMVLRVLVVVLTAVVVIQTATPSGTATLLALAGFFFALLLLEPLHLRRGSENAA